MSKKLYRSRDDRMIAGVCGGLAEYFGVDSTLIRLAVLFIFLFQGIGLIAYLIAWLVMSEEPQYKRREKADSYYIEDEKKSYSSGRENLDRETRKEGKAADDEAREKAQDFNDEDLKQKENLNNENDYESRKYIEGGKEDKESRRRKLFAVILIGIGAIFLVDIWIPALYWERYWPLILIAAGILLLKGDNND